MSLSRLVAGISLAALLAMQAGAALVDCEARETPRECGCPAPEGEGASIDAPCCCGCVAPNPHAPGQGGKAPLQAPAKDSSAPPPPQVHGSVAPPILPDPSEPIALTQPPTPPLFLLHRSFRK